MPDRREEILKMLTVLAENFEAAPSPARMAMVVKELEPYTLEQITEGLPVCCAPANTLASPPWPKYWKRWRATNRSAPSWPRKTPGAA